MTVYVPIGNGKFKMKIDTNEIVHGDIMASFIKQREEEFIESIHSHINASSINYVNFFLGNNFRKLRIYFRFNNFDIEHPAWDKISETDNSILEKIIPNYFDEKQTLNDSRIYKKYLKSFYSIKELGEFIDDTAVKILNQIESCKDYKELGFFDK